MPALSYAPRAMPACSNDQMNGNDARPGLLITRPHDGAQRFAADAEAAGFAPLLDPMLRLIPRPPPDAGAFADAQALLLTSPAAAALAAVAASPDLQVLAVGDATAAAALAAGFTDVISAAGDGVALARLAAKILDPKAGRIIHGAGAKRAGDLAGVLARQGFQATTLVLYEQQPAQTLAQSTVDALAAGRLNYASFFSPQTGSIFGKVVLNSGMIGNLSDVSAVAISGAVRDTISGLGWKSVMTAQRPTSAALLAQLVSLAFDGTADNGADRPR